MTIWKPDTCDCILEYNNSKIWVKTWLKCRLHKPLKRQNLLDACMDYNRGFNMAFGSEPNEEQRELITLSKKVTKLKIRLGEFDGELPTQSTLIKLKNFLRL